MSSGHREAIVRPSCTIRNNIVCKTASSSIFASPSCIIVSYSCVHRVSIVWPSVGFVYASGSILAFYQIRDENRAKLKISYSCGHRVSKSARYDATLTSKPPVLAPKIRKIARYTPIHPRFFYIKDVFNEVYASWTLHRHLEGEKMHYAGVIPSRF